jgi:hypothetical protein
VTPVGTAVSGAVIVLCVLAVLVARDRGRQRSTWDGLRVWRFASFVACGAILFAAPPHGIWRFIGLLGAVGAAWAAVKLVQLERSR